MASVASLGINWSTAAGDKTLTVTPTLNDLIVIVACHTGQVSATTITDNNSDGLGTYTLGKIGDGGTTARGIWVRDALIGSATSTIFTSTASGNTGGGFQVFRVSGITKTGSAAVKSSGNQINGTLGTTPTITLSATALTGNPLVGYVQNGSIPAGVTEPSGWTESQDTSYASPSTGLETVFIDSGFTSNTVTWQSTSATAFNAVVVEIDSSASGETDFVGMIPL